MPLVLLNVGFLALIVTVGPAYGWLPIALIGAVVSAVDLYIVRSLR
jgi:hypothetical protein